jgi:hypothetical protein
VGYFVRRVGSALKKADLLASEKWCEAASRSPSQRHSSFRLLSAEDLTGHKSDSHRESPIVPQRI